MPLSAPGISGIWQTKKKETGLTKEEVSEVGIISDIFVCVVEVRAGVTAQFAYSSNNPQGENLCVAKKMLTQKLFGLCVGGQGNRIVGSCLRWPTEKKSGWLVGISR